MFGSKPFPIPKDLRARTELFVRIVIHYAIDQPILDREGVLWLLKHKETPPFERGSEQVKLAASRLLTPLLAGTLDWDVVQDECQDLCQKMDDAAVQRFLAWKATKYLAPLGGVRVSGAACQACVVKVGRLTNGVGLVGEPFGACLNCHALACGFHGSRDPYRPRFMCVECDPNLLCASAVVKATGSSAADRPNMPGGPLFLEMLRGYRGSWLPPEDWAFRSVDDFRERRPGYDPTLCESAISRSREIRSLDGELETIWVSLPRDSKEMLMLAALITRRLEIPEQQLSAFMRTLRNSLK